MSTSIVLGVDASPAFKPGEHILDFMPLPIKGFVIGDGADKIQS